MTYNEDKSKNDNLTGKKGFPLSPDHEAIREAFAKKVTVINFESLLKSSFLFQFSPFLIPVDLLS